MTVGGDRRARRALATIRQAMNANPARIAANTVVCAHPPRASLPQSGFGRELRQSLSGRSSGKNSLIVGRVVSSSSSSPVPVADAGALVAALVAARVSAAATALPDGDATPLASTLRSSVSARAARPVGPVVNARFATVTVYHRGS